MESDEIKFRKKIRNRLLEEDYDFRGWVTRYLQIRKIFGEGKLLSRKKSNEYRQECRKLLTLIKGRIDEVYKAKKEELKRIHKIVEEQNIRPVRKTKPTVRCRGGGNPRFSFLCNNCRSPIIVASATRCPRCGGIVCPVCGACRCNYNRWH